MAKKETPSQVNIASKKLRQKLGDEVVYLVIELVKMIIDEQFPIEEEPTKEENPAKEDPPESVIIGQ